MAGSAIHSDATANTGTMALPKKAGLLGVALVNALLLVLIALGRLSPYELLFVFFLELAVIGLAALLRLAVAALIGHPFESRYTEASRGGTLLLSFISGIFFVTKFGAILLGFGILLVTLPNDSLWNNMSSSDLGPWVSISLWVLLASHAYEFVVRFLIGRGYRDVRVWSLLAYPYVRGMWIVVAIGLALVATATTDLASRPVLFSAAVLLVKTLFDALCAWWTTR